MIIAKKRIAGKEQAYVRKYKQYSQHCKRSGGRRRCDSRGLYQHPSVIGDYVTVGHNAVVHGCTVGDYSLIGMGAVVLNGAKIGKHCLVGAGSLVLEGQEIPDGSLAVGNPAKVKRMLTEQEKQKIYENSMVYVETGKRLKKDGYARNE